MLLWHYQKMVSTCWFVILERDIFVVLPIGSEKEQTLYGE